MPRILVVDDDKSVLNAIKMLLELEGYDVVAVNNGQDGIEAISTETFDVAIVDIFMPGTGGLQTIKAFNQHAPGVPVIAISGLVFRDASAAILNFPTMSTTLNVFRALQKPFRPRDLVNAIVVGLNGKLKTSAACQ
jgi:CheY-like chemotaxis protein